jgi:hypothetical protein
MRTARNFPSIDKRLKLIAAAPKMIGLLLEFFRGNRVGGDDEGTLSFDSQRDLGDVAVGTHELRHSETEEMRRAMIRPRIFRNLEARDHEHTVLIPGPSRFGPDDLEVKRKRRLGERVFEIPRRQSEKRSVLANVISNGDGAEAPCPVEVNELGDRHRTVAESRVRMQIGDNHAQMVPAMFRFLGQKTVKNAFLSKS